MRRSFDLLLVAATEDFHDRFERGIKKAAHLPPGVAVSFPHETVADQAMFSFFICSLLWWAKLFKGDCGICFSGGGSVSMKVSEPAKRVLSLAPRAKADLPLDRLVQTFLFSLSWRKDKLKLIGHQTDPLPLLAHRMAQVKIRGNICPRKRLCENSTSYAEGVE
ncbi:MAG TPA: hypothetical protein DCK93_04500 [Blastocatellia bacterium]|jgi:hypothetical protein|nr:hypothetical protein [Blastocatellia bacterium]HAF22166.1 hypothetical protein [Blastocatellia bacterium]